jgi:predicted membrane protein
MDNEMKNSFRSGYTKGLGFGLVLMVIGVVFLGFNFGLVPETLRSTIISWQMLLIVIGVVHLFRRRLVSGVVLIFIGGFFIIPKLVPAINGQFIHLYWPLLLIAAGVVILLQRVLGPQCSSEKWNHEWNHCHRHHHNREYRHHQSKWGASAEGGFSRNSVFASGDHIVLDPEFKGGDLNAVFGGISLDLRRTSLPVGETIIEVNAVFGGITIYVPTDWYVETHLDSVFGGFQDNRMPKEPLDTTRKLIIVGSCVFGGGELRN